MPRRTPQETGADSFGKRLRQLRLGRGWTQAELSRRVQIERAVIGNYERGFHYPAIPVLVRLAQAFEVSVDRLLGLDDEHPAEIQDRQLHQLFLQVDRMDAGTQGLVKQVVEKIVGAGHPIALHAGQRP